MNYYDEQDDIKAFANIDGCLKRVLYALCAVVLTVLVLIFKT